MTTTQDDSFVGLTAERKVRADYHTAALFPAEATVFHEGIRCLVVRNGTDAGGFHLIAAGGQGYGDVPPYNPMPDGAFGTIYQPIHPSQEPEDIMGATYAWDDGTYWHIAHCSPHEQIDFARQAERFTYGEVQDAINRAQATLGLAHDDASRAGGKGKVDALINFAYAAGRDSYLRVRISGFVSLLFMPAIIRLRVARSTISDITL